MELFENFVRVSAASTQIINKYKDSLPEELIGVWKKYGFGSLLDGYLKVIDPEEFQQILNDSYFRASVSIPIFATGMADLITWEENKYLRLVKYRRGNFHGISAGFEFFFSDLSDEGFCDRHLDWLQYKGAVAMKGKLGFNDCFGYVPLLGLGGAEQVEHLQKVQIKDHILLINELVGPIQ